MKRVRLPDGRQVLRNAGPLKKGVFIAAALVLAIFAVYGVTIIGTYVGYATHQGYGGNIYEIVIEHSVAEFDWVGVYGVAVRVEGFTDPQFELMTGGELEEKNLLYDCLEPNIEHEIYATLATPSNVDFNSVVAGTPADVDAFLGKVASDTDSGSNTFTETAVIQLGAQSITAPATYTYKIDEVGTPNTFVTTVLIDGNSNLIYGIKTSNFTSGFNGRTYNYQAILPVPENSSLTYYFYTDPNDECPTGEGTEPNRGVVIGNVSDTSGNRLENVIVDIAGNTNTSDVTGYYYLTPRAGNYYIWAIIEGYEVYQNNITVSGNSTTIHDITLTPVIEQNTNTGTSNGVGPGQSSGVDAEGEETETGVDVGPGEVPPVPFSEQPKEIEGTDYVISLNDLRRKVRPNEFLQEAIHVFSFKKETITVTFEITGNASKLIDLDNDQLLLEPNSNGEVILTIYGRDEPGFYNGTLVIDGDINATVPVLIEIVSKDKLPVEALQMDVETARKELLPGQELKFKTDLRNLLIEHPYAVNILYTIQSADGGEIIWTETTNTYLRTAFTVIKGVDLPDDMAAGDYILRATANYLGLNSASSTLFTVNVPFWQRILFGLRYWHWLLIILTVSALAGAGYYYWRLQDSKKKFHIKVDYKELPAPGPRNIEVGRIAETDHKTHFNLEQFKVHTIVAGSTGGGKSVSAQVIIEEALEKGVAVIAFDPTAQWTGMLRPCKDKLMLSLYPLYGMKKTDARGYPGNVRMILDKREQININKYVKPGEIQVFCFHKLNPKDMDIVVANAIRSIFNSGPKENKPLKVMFVFDEVHRLLPKFGGSGDGFLQIERACREFRKWGLGVMLISQVLADFVGTIKANINTEIQMRTRDEGDLERIRQKYGEEVLRSLVKATVGSGMVENPAYNRGQPYFVAFRPLKHSTERMDDEEIQKYNDYNDKMDGLFYSLEQLEAENVDVFDLKLELKLALDKVKAGNFNMVDVYLEGLTPRITKEWEKIGKQPKAFERELVDEAELAADLAKAKAERDKKAAEEKGAGGAAAGAEEKKEHGWKDDVAPDKMLNLTNGMIVISLSSLYDELAPMKDGDLANHFVPGEKNDFAKWVMEALEDTKLAYNLYAADTREKMVEILEMKRDEKELPDAKPPAWLGKTASAATTPAASAATPPPADAAAPVAADAPATPGEGAAQAPSAEQQSAAPETPAEKAFDTLAKDPAPTDPAQKTPEKVTPAASATEQASPAVPASSATPAATATTPAATATTPSAATEPSTVAPATTPQEATAPVAGTAPASPAATVPASNPAADEGDNIPTQTASQAAAKDNAAAFDTLAKDAGDAPKSTPETTLSESATLPPAPSEAPSKTATTPVPSENQSAATADAASATDASASTEPASSTDTKQSTETSATATPQTPDAATATQQTPDATAATQQTQIQTPTAVPVSGPYDSLEAAADHAFKFDNGVAIHGMKELKDYLPQMPEDIFTKHVSADYNHFADWAQGAFNNDDLAQKMRESSTKDAMLALLMGKA